MPLNKCATDHILNSNQNKMPSVLFIHFQLMLLLYTIEASSTYVLLYTTKTRRIQLITTCNFKETPKRG